MRIHFFLLGMLVASVALAEPDSFGLGTGRLGSLHVSTPNTVINHYGQLTVSTAAGTKDLTISNAAAFTAGELVLLHQSSGLPAPDSGKQTAIDLSGSSVGRFEYARIKTVNGNTLRLTAALQYSYAANVTQVVSVPEYTDFTVDSGASVKAQPWDGSVGGILALLATGRLTNEGVISVDGQGFRGGPFINHPNLYTCNALDEPAGDGGSYKGEGLVSGRFLIAAGRGNLANGAGGGNCHSSGGAGGGHAGVGGRGGFTTRAEAVGNVGGLGGAPVHYQPYDHLVFGGGGGGGAGHESFGTGGAAGGGIMILRALEVAGGGQFSARGASADFVTPSIDDGAGGGGAGGAISIRVAQALTCGLAQAPGGEGGDTRHPTSESGPGGGGSGGVVFLQAALLACPVSVFAGYPGQSTAEGGPYGAGPNTVDGGTSYGSDQTIELAYEVPTTPELTVPQDGDTGLPSRPRIEGIAGPGVIIHLLVDGAPYLTIVTDSKGDFTSSSSPALADGPHELQAVAEVLGAYSPQSEVVHFQIGTGEPPDGGGLPDGGSTDGGTSDGGITEQPPLLSEPQEGEEVDPLTVFEGSSLSGASVSIEVDGVEVARVPLDAQRRFSYTLTSEQKLASGAHSALVRAWEASGEVGLSSPTTNFQVKLPTALDVNCGCGASPGAGLGALVMLLAWNAARLRRRS